MKPIYSHSIVFVIGIILSFFIVKCNPNRFIECDSMDCYEEKTTTEIEYIKGDSVIVHHTTFIEKRLTPKKTSVSDVDSSRSSIVVNEFNDSLVDVSVTTKLNGKIEYQFIDYKAKIPTTTITIVDTIKITNTITQSPIRYNRVYAVGGVQGNETFIQYGVGAAFQTGKNNMIYEATYNFNDMYGDNISLGIKIPILKFKKK